MERINIFTLVLSIAVLGTGCSATQEVAVVSEEVISHQRSRQSMKPLAAPGC